MTRARVVSWYFNPETRHDNSREGPTVLRPRLRKGLPMSFWRRLFVSPGGRVLRDSPFAFYLAGGLFLLVSLDGLRTGRMQMRGGAVVERAQSPDAFLFAVVALSLGGLGLLLWGWRVWRRTGEWRG